MLKRLLHGPPMIAFMALRHLKALIAKREAELILRARREGMPWMNLGAFLGVSAQAAHQRWARLIDAEERA